MPINYQIEADVIDIRVDSPQEDDTFLVDTNVWYWLTYSRASQCSRPPAQHQISTYPNYTNQALAVDARICQVGLSLSELTHLIEKAECEIFSIASGAVRTIRPKEFRHNFSTQRSQVVAEIQSVWAQVESLAESLDVEIDSATTTTALNSFGAQKIDGYDLFILEAMRKHSVTNIITDDGDFATVPGINLFTANRNVINAARSQGKLVTR